MALKGGQKKLDKNKNNRIDAQDFKILKAEKAKGRGMGLQDEKVKPGKVMKAALGAVALGLGAKKLKEKGKLMPLGLGAAMMKKDKMKEILGRSKGGGADTGTAGERRSRVGVLANKFKRRARREGFSSKPSSKITPGAGPMRPIPERLSKQDISNFLKDQLKSIMKPPSGAHPGKFNKGGGADTGTRGEMRSKLSVAADRFKRRMSQMPGKLTDEERKKIRELLKDVKPARPARPMPNIKSDGPKRPMPSRPKPSLGPMARRMGGGMMNKPMGYKKGTMVMARGCKLGRKKPTKIM